MSLLDDVQAVSNANRLADLERLTSSETIVGDFVGSATGRWVRLNKNGAGIVEYNQKRYVTRPLGFTSIPAGTAVELTHANGIYYSKW
jgi:hypothetical protein